MSDDDNDKRRFERMADKAVAEAGKVRRELGRGLALASAKDPRVLSPKALARLGPEGVTAYVGELRRVFGRPSSDLAGAAAKATTAHRQTPAVGSSRPPETVEGWSELRFEKRSPVAAGILLGSWVGFALLLLCALWLAPGPFC
ncbi:MAG: hypothetical protein LCH80_07455 [Proteobacteria bacterium]|nr:hypothetical protein [Pseudomonadota bacterium]